MFADSKFNEDISNWDLSYIKPIDKYNIFTGCPIKNRFKPKGTN
jgi:hypothetical protein